MIRLRLQRQGSKKRPVYRVVAANQRSARGGRFIDLLGTYDLSHDPIAINLNMERVEYWLKTGAQPTETVQSLINKVKKGATITIADAAKRSREAYEALQKKAASEAKEVIPVAPAPVVVAETATNDAEA